MLDLSFTNSTKHKAFTRPFFKKILESAIKSVKLEKKRVGLSVNLVGKVKIQTLNKKYRNKNKPTDVLSFPLHNQILPNKPKEAILELGDIFICPDVLVDKLKNLDKTLNDEIKFLTIHGFLHLLGHDHEKSRIENKKMSRLQDIILKQLK